MYQSRMRILQSRDGTNGRRAKIGERILSENSFSSSFVDRGTRTPCPAEKLLPPMQLMTRERSFRHLYLKYHPPKVHVRMDFLKKKEDPKFKKKKEDIFARIKAAELSAERIKREKERVAGHRRSIFNDGLGLSGTSISDHSGNDESHQDMIRCESINGQKDCVLVNDDSSVVLVSGFVTDPSKKDESAATVISTNTNSSIEENSEEEVYAGSFAFLADWKKEKRIKSCTR
jgi:hypothetical protein